MDATLERQITSASRSVEEARRAAHRNAARIGALVEQISVLADLRQKEGDFRKAESLYREALFRIQEERKPDAELVTGIYSLMAHMYDRWGHTKISTEFYEKALKNASDHGIESSDRVAIIKNNLGMLFKHLRDYERAEKYYLEALEIFGKTDGERSARVASVLNNLGVLYYSTLDLERAQSMHEHALGIRQNLHDEQIDPLDLAQTYINLAATAKAVGDFQNAEIHVNHARKLQAGTNGYHPNPRRAATLLIDKNL